MLYLFRKRNLVLTIGPWENLGGPSRKRGEEIDEKAVSQGEANHSSMLPGELFNEPECHSMATVFSRFLGDLICFQGKLGCL